MQGKTSRTTVTKIWVRAPELPTDVIEADVLTDEDIRDITLDHIARTCEVVFRVDLIKWA